MIFYLPISEELKPFRPIPKFLCIKTVIFFAFWQGTFVAFLGWVGAIKPDQDWSISDFSLFIQDSLICVEMFFVAIAHGYAFGYIQYKDAEVEPLFVELRKSGVSAFKPGTHVTRFSLSRALSYLTMVVMVILILCLDL